MGWLITTGAFLVILFVGLYLIYLFAFHNDIKDDDIYHVPNTDQYQALADRMRSGTQKMAALDFEQVYIKSPDGTMLAGRYYHLSDDAPVQLQMHGYRGNALRDFCGGFHLARRMGHNVLSVDQRAHGKSGSKTITFGVKEREDCAAWANYLYNRMGEKTPIFLCGVSMGAASVIMATELELPPTVVGVIADCPYSSPKAIIQKVCKDMKLPAKVAYPFVILAGLVYGKFAIWKSAPEKAIQNTKVPVLLLHGEDDRFVPCEMGKQLYARNKQMVRLETFPDAGHGLSYLVDTPRYEKIVRQFVSACLRKD